MWTQYLCVYIVPYLFRGDIGAVVTLAKRISQISTPLPHVGLDEWQWATYERIWWTTGAFTWELTSSKQVKSFRSACETNGSALFYGRKVLASIDRFSLIVASSRLALSSNSASGEARGISWIPVNFNWRLWEQRPLQRRRDDSLGNDVGRLTWAGARHAFPLKKLGWIIQVMYYFKLRCESCVPEERESFLSQYFVKLCYFF